MQWSKADEEDAYREGWNLFMAYGVTDPAAKGEAFSWRLERDDEAAVFADDAEAWAHVRAKAAAGSAMHQRALDFLRDNAPTELARIMAAP